MPLPELPAVSVVIVNFNSGTWLARCVDSVLASTIPVEVLVIDNASEDGSLQEALRRYRADSRLSVHHNRANEGFARAANKGLIQARAPFILLLNPDCVLGPTTLEAMLEILAAHPRVGMAGCLIRNEDGTEQRGCRRRIPTPWSAMGRVLGGRVPISGFDMAGSPLPAIPVAVEAISGAFMLVRREAAAKVGCLDEAFFMHCEDLDWCVRFAKAGYEILFVPSVEIFHKQGVCSNKTPIRVEWFKHRGMARFYGKHATSVFERTVAPFIYLAIYVRFAAKALVLGLSR